MSEPAADLPDGDAPAIWMLAVGQTLGFATLYYIYGALLVSIEAETGWDRPALAIGLTLALMVSAVAVPLTGRLVDAGLGAEILAGGAAFGGLALLALSQAQSLTHWYLAWCAIGLAMSACLYDTCFAFLTRRLGSAARPAIIRVTLVAGLASTLAFPLGAVLADAYGWRIAVIVFGLMQMALTAPLHYGAGYRLRCRERPGSVRPPESGGALARAMRQAQFWFLAASFGLVWMNHSMLVTYFIPLFTGLGATKAIAVAAASTVGPFQVVGRLALMMRGERTHILTSTRASLICISLASLVLMAAGMALPFVFLFAMMQGAAIGMMSILRPVLIAEVLGQQGFGAISGGIAAVPLVANAAAPFIGALLLESGGVYALLTGSLLIGAGSVGFACLVRTRAER